MPEDKFVWITLIVVAAIVVIFALSRGDFVEVTTNPLGLKFRRKAPGRVGDGDKAGISVGEGMTLKGSTVRGDIVGVKTSDSGGNDSTQGASVRVLDKASVENATVEGDIAGRKGSDRKS